MKTYLLYLLVFWAGINDALMVAVTTVMASNSAAQIKGAALLSPFWVMLLAAFVVLAKSLEKSIAGWIEGLRKLTTEAQSAQSLKGPVMPITGAALVLACCLLFVGCATSGNRAVPGNHISGALGGVPFSIDNPKNFQGEGFSLALDQGTNHFTLKIDKFQSTNDPEVIGESFAGQLAVTKAQFEGINGTLEKLIQLGKQGSAAVATGGASELLGQAGPAPTGRKIPRIVDTGEVYEFPGGDRGVVRK